MAAECNCPPLRDVVRYGVGTKPECPVHPTPENLAEMLVPRLPVDEDLVNLRPIAVARCARRS